MLTIGEFSRLSHVSPRMLRHYDALGLLRPETVGDNGYRYFIINPCHCQFWGRQSAKNNELPPKL